MRSDFLSNGFKASEELLLILEDAKKKLDDSIDRLPGVYVVFDQEGMIYRHNNEFSQDFKENSKSNNNIFDFLSNKEKHSLKSLMENCLDNLNKVIDHEIQFNNDKTFALSLYAWKPASGSEKIFYTSHGRDVSELKNLLLQKNYLAREVQGAEQIQKLMLPEQEAKISQSHISCFYRPAAECSGDFLHYSQHKNGLILWAGDVTGHGVGAAMISGCVRSAIALLEDDPVKLDLMSAMPIGQINRPISASAIPPFRRRLWKRAFFVAEPIKPI